MNKNKQQHATELAQILKLIAHPTRLLIICILKDGEKSAGALLEIIGTTKGNISQHLKILIMGQILCFRKDANKIYYTIRDKRLTKTINHLEKIYCKG